MAAVSVAKAIMARLNGAARWARSFSGPRRSNVAAAHSSRCSRASAGQPTRSGTTVSGKAVARSVTASKLLRVTSVATSFEAA